MRKKKVLFFLPESVGGAERVSITISKFLDSEEYEVVYAIIGKNIGDIKHFLPSGKKLIHIKTRNIWDFTVCKLIRLLRKERPDFTFSSNRYLNVRILLASRIVGNIRSIVRNDNGLETVRWDNKIFMKFTYRWADKIIAQQDEMKHQLIDVMKFPSNKILTLHNPIDIETIEKKLEEKSPYDNKDCIKFVWVGRFAKTKGQDVLVKAFSVVHQIYPNSELYFIGKYSHDSYCEFVKELIQAYHLEEFVHMIGFDNNPYKWIKYCDCFVLPSRYEGLPNGLIEAMYIGKPVVATRCIPIVDRIVKDGYNGYLVEPEDYQTMADRMQKALLLRDFKMTYRPNSIDDFRSLFR